MAPRVMKVLPRPVRRRVNATRKARIYQRLDDVLLGSILSSQGELDDYRTEFVESGLIQHLDDASAEFNASVAGVTGRGNPYWIGEVGMDAAARLYAVIRALKPSVAVETGVCNGYSTAVLLEALERNGSGELYSVDLPEVEGEVYDEGLFWEEKTGEVVPRGREPGWVIPDRLRGRWHLTLGRSQDVLEPLLDRLGEMQFFMHDSEHSYECMTFEFKAAYARLAVGGVLAADDVNLNTAFQDFARATGHHAGDIGDNVALFVKRG